MTLEMIAVGVLSVLALLSAAIVVFHRSPVICALALVPLPFYLEYADRLALRPILQAGMAENPEQTWTLVSGKGKVVGPGSLDGWEITGRGGYSATFVRNIALDGWGALPATASVTFTVPPFA